MQTTILNTDADKIAHSVYEPGSQAIQDVVNGFGSDILEPNSETIDRKKLGSIVFADRNEMAVRNNDMFFFVFCFG